KPITNNDWRSLELADDCLIVIDNLGQSDRCEVAWIAAKLFDVAVHAWPAFCDNRVAFVRVIFDPTLPTERGHPQTGNENDGGDVNCANSLQRLSNSPGNSSPWRKLNAVSLLMSSGSC